MARAVKRATFNFNEGDNEFFVIKNKTGEVERVEEGQKEVSIFLNSDKYFKVKNHIIDIIKGYSDEEEVDVKTEKITFLIEGLKKRLRK